MRLYHFTSLGHLPVIVATGGLWRGEVPVGDGSRTLRATWFTTDPDPRGHGLDGSAADKREVRITVVIPSSDRGLKHWLNFTRTSFGWLADECVEQLVRTGGGKRKAETWYIYPDQIPPAEFRAIEIRRPDGSYTHMEPADLAASVAHEALEEAVRADFSEMRARMPSRAA